MEIVEFFGDDNLIGSDSSEPFGIVWENISVGEHTIYVNAVDNDGLVSTSSTFSFEVIQAPECTGGPDNGHYTYEFSEDLNNPTITFIPSASHVGDPTCILYYSTSGIPRVIMLLQMNLSRSMLVRVKLFNFITHTLTMD